MRAGVNYLLANQNSDGSWKDESWTGTGFPEVFYLNYHFYATYFPLLALETWRKNQQVGDAEILETGEVHPLGIDRQPGTEQVR